MGSYWYIGETTPLRVFAHPDWSKAEDFDAFLARGLGPLLKTGNEPYLRRFLGKGR